MGKWKMVRLGDVCSKTKKDNPSSHYRTIAYIAISSIDSENKKIISYNTMSSKEAPSRARQIVFPGDILVSTVRPNLNAVAIIDTMQSNLIASTGFCVLRPNKNFIIKKYLFEYLKSQSFINSMSQQATGASYPAVSDKIVLNEYIPLPPLEVQQKIATVLDRASALIDFRKAQIDKLDLLIKSQFIEMFGLPGSNNGKWKLYRLGDCCELNPKKSSDSRLTSDLTVSFIPMSSISENGSINTTIQRSYDEVKTGFTYFMDSDVLFAKITPCMENGKGAIAKELCNGVGFGSTEFHVLRPIKGKSNSYWLYTLTTLKHFRIDAATNMTGSAGQRRVPATFLENYKVSLPPISLQNEFAAFVKQVEAQKKLLQQSLSELELNYKSLMQKCFRGEIF